MKEFEIWIGYYHLGQGYGGTTEPQLLGRETASAFDIACLKYELRSKLDFLDKYDDGKYYIGSQEKEWWYNPQRNSNSWTGKYYQSKEEALKSFK